MQDKIYVIHILKPHFKHILQKTIYIYISDMMEYM